MSVIVVGCGRSGTNVALEVLSGSPDLKASVCVEHKLLFKQKFKQADNYLTKCDTIFFDYPEFKKLMDDNPSMKIIWTIRDPRDICMSKMKRGVPIKRGGDCQGFSPDGTTTGCVADIKRMYYLYKKAIGDFKDRILLIKMEEILCSPVYSAKRMCKFLGIQYDEAMIEFWKRMRNEFKVDRYKGIDKSQICMWHNWKSAYNRWLRKFNMPLVFNKVNEFVQYFGYSIVIFGHGHLLDTTMMESNKDIVDAGAATGETIVSLESYLPENYLIHSLEPCKTNFAKLASREFENVKLYQAALLGKKRNTDLIFTEFVGKAGKLYQWGNVNNLCLEAASNRKDFIKVKKYAVNHIEVNEFFKELKEVSLFKMDIEGSESGVIKNMTRATADKIKQITFEIHDFSSRNINFLTDRLFDLGFKTVFRFDKELYASKLSRGEQYVKTEEAA